MIEVQRVKNAFKSSIDELTKIEVGKKGHRGAEDKGHICGPFADFYMIRVCSRGLRI